MWIKVDGGLVHLNFGHGKAARKKEAALKPDTHHERAEAHDLLDCAGTQVRAVVATR